MSDKRIVIIGAGFAALTAIREIRKHDSAIAVTVVAPLQDFIYLPSLIWIPSGMREADDLRIPLAPYFKRMHVEHIVASATGLRDGGRVVETTAGDVANDGLIIAAGSRYMRKLPGIEHAIIPCTGIDAAEQVRDRLQAMDGGTIAVGFAGNPKEPSAMRGGPMFEFLFGIDNLLVREKRRDRFDLVFFSPAPQPGKRMGPQAVEKILGEMKRRNIDTHLGHKMKGFTASTVKTEGGEFNADMILFMPGMTGAAWCDDTELPRSAGGFIQANAMCQVEGHERVYVAGDAGSFPGPDWMPKQAHMADLQAVAAVQNLLQEFAGQPASQTFKTELICIVDSLRDGMMVARTPSRNFSLPPLKLLHWGKRLFEWWYLREYRQ